MLHNIARLLVLPAALAGTAGIAAAASADFPTRPIRFVIPYAPGGGTDIVGRIVAQRLSERLGQQVVVDNRPGAGSIIGSEIVLRAAPDGYTMLLANIAHGTNPWLHKKMPYDAVKDFTPVTLMALLPSVLAVPSSMPVKTVKDFIDLAKSKPGALTYATAGIGSANHLTMELFKVTTGTDIVHVAFKGGGPAIASVLAGQISSVFVTIPPAHPHVRSGRVKALGVSASIRHPSLPEVPTVAESGLPGFEVYEWHSILLPARAPKEIVAKINAETNAVLAIPEVRARITDLGANVIGSTPEKLAEHIRSELTTWQRVIKQANITVE